MTDRMSPAGWVRIAARIGLGARATVYFLISLLLGRAIFINGGDGEEASPTGAFLALQTQVWGRAVLVAIGLGLVIHLGWRVLQGVLDLDRAGKDLMGRLSRLGMFLSGIGYSAIAVAAFSVAFDQDDGSGGTSAPSSVGWLLNQPFGQPLVAVVGLAMATFGAVIVWQGVSGNWKQDLVLDRRTRPFELISGYAIIGRGVLFVVAAVSILWAAFSLAPDDALGIAETLGWLRRQAFGLWLYVAATLVFAGYGVFSALLVWRYRPGADFTS